MKQFIKNLISGLVLLIPIALTFYIVFRAVVWLDNLTRPLFNWLFGVDIFGIGILFVIAIIYLVGILSNTRVGILLTKITDKLMDKAPQINKLYKIIKDVVKALLGKDKQSFKKVVRVEFPMKGTYSVGFITNETEELTAIMIPTCPNISNGFLIYTNDYEILDMEVDKAIKRIMSMGVLLGSKMILKKTEETN